MEKMNDNWMEQIEKMRKERKKVNLKIEEGIKRDKEKCIEERKKLEKRIDKLKWEKKRKDREERRNNMIRGINKWEINGARSYEIY